MSCVVKGSPVQYFNFSLDFDSYIIPKHFVGKRYTEEYIPSLKETTVFALISAVIYKRLSMDIRINQDMVQCSLIS